MQKLIKSTPQKPISRIPVSPSDLYVPNYTSDALRNKAFLIDKYMKQNNIFCMYMCPVYETITANTNNWAEECISGRLPIDYQQMNLAPPEEYFFFHIEGDEMNKVAKDGAFALIHKQDFIENGQIALVIVDNNDAILRKYTKQGELIILEPVSGDPTYSVQAYGVEAKIMILGKYVGKFEINK